ncbi:hypothetical protein FRC09_018552 [Ceratobasidium sp. 395]|nr:hypothetical protein FRC09_018552 [Ceratobasidium sp. 395]
MLPIVYGDDQTRVSGTGGADRIDLSGPLLVGTFAMDNQVKLAALIIWNWTIGQEIMRLVVKTRDHTRRTQTRVFDFLSDDTLVICRRFDSTEELAQGLPENTFGLLDIYKFDPLATSPAVLVTSLALPANIIEGEIERPATRLLCISIGGKFDWENVCVQAQTLLEYAGTTNNSIVRWEEWGLRAAWDKRKGRISYKSYRIRSHGHRLFTLNLGISNEMDIKVSELKRKQDGRIVPILSMEFGIRPNLSKQDENEVPWIGPRSEFEMNDESILAFREGLMSSVHRDLLLWEI